MTNRRFWLWLTAIVLAGDCPARRSFRRRSPMALHRRRRLARRRRVGPQRAQQGALRRVAAGRMEPGVHRAGLHGARVRLVRGVRRRRAAGAAGQRGRGPALRDPAGARRRGGSPAIARGPDRRRAARDQLRLRDVQPRRDHGSADGRLHRRVVVLLDARGATPRWGALAGVMATLAFFTKAAAAFYVGALGLAAVDRGWWKGGTAGAGRKPDADGTSTSMICSFRLQAEERAVDARRARGLVRVVAALFVLPHWRDYQFYNWQMSVTRKPSYDLASVLQRVTWFPILHDTFSRMWGVLALGVDRRVGHPGALAPGDGRRAAAVPLGRGRHRRTADP